MSGGLHNSNLFYDIFTKQNFNVNTSHPLIPSSQEYIYYKKFISIHSEDRDLLKYPNSSEFEIELPEDYLNVVTLRLVNWTFPANYNTFSTDNQNLLLIFRMINPYNPSEHGLSDEYSYRIFEALFANQERNYLFFIEEGFYNPIQMVTELTNKFNFAVSKIITEYFTEQNNLHPGDGWDLTLAKFNANGGYNRFIVVYNSVSQKIWFGNNADGFVIINEAGIINSIFNQTVCSSTGTRQAVPDFSVYGLSGYLGLPRQNTIAVNSSVLVNFSEYEKYNGIIVPRFYYGDVFPGDNGFWLLPNPDLPGCYVHWVECLYKINLMGEAYIYMEIHGQNCIDETQPYTLNDFTLTTNQTNGIVNAAFAKLAVPSTPISQWFDRDAIPYKLYNPPAERIRRLRFRLRYHNGELVNFNTFNYSFMLEFTLLVPQILRNTKAVAMPPTGR
jgi:hypothetical protein